MVPEVFYQTVAQLSFTLLGLWWLVLQTKYSEWIHRPPAPTDGHQHHPLLSPAGQHEPAGVAGHQ